ncbi:nuclear transport factor 2 family protein [Salinibacterium sp.]|uniref:nuclear transport factor 2 family protein n=1 Tax=Salinibacterium sp. TaxID=1915057 RepID=UPI00286B952C|nr:nuclear transport factor 2 family protein [Salinibacterium sp.]
MTSDKDPRASAVHYLRQWEVRDYAAMRSLCTATATVWHSDGSGDQSIDENMALLEQLASQVDTLRYDIVRQFQNDDAVFQQQVLHLTMTDGSCSDVHAAMYFRFDGDLIDRIEEYFNVVPLTESTTPIAWLGLG